MAYTKLANAMDILLATLESENPYNDDQLYHIVKDLCSYSEYLAIMRIMKETGLIKSARYYTIQMKARAK